MLSGWETFYLPFHITFWAPRYIFSNPILFWNHNLLLSRTLRPGRPVGGGRLNKGKNSYIPPFFIELWIRISSCDQTTSFLKIRSFKKKRNWMDWLYYFIQCQKEQGCISFHLVICLGHKPWEGGMGVKRGAKPSKIWHMGLKFSLCILKWESEKGNGRWARVTLRETQDVLLRPSFSLPPRFSPFFIIRLLNVFHSANSTPLLSSQPLNTWVVFWARSGGAAF